jgi:hypothetical protein
MALSEDGCLQQLNLRYNINTNIKNILSTITTFGSVSIETSPPSVFIKTMKAKSLCNLSMVFEFLESCFNSLSVFDLIFSSVHPILVEYSVLVYLNVSLF